MKASKLPSGNWRVRVTEYIDDQGKPHRRSFTASTKKEAEIAAAEFLRRCSRAPGIRRVTFRSALLSYINSKDKILSPSTLREYRRYLEADLSINDLDVIHIDQHDIQQCINQYSSGRSPKTVRNLHAMITAVIHSVRPDMIINTTLPQKKVYDLSIPSDDDIKKILDLCDDKLKICVQLAIYCPARRGEICAVKYSDISDGILHIHSTFVRGPEGWIYKETPKTCAGDRRIPLPESLLSLIGSGEGFIIPWTPSQMYDRFKTVCIRAGVKMRFHDLRHFGASYLHSLGIPDSYLMRRGGWDSDYTLKHVYRHTLTKEEERFNNIAEKGFSNLI